MTHDQQAAERRQRLADGFAACTERHSRRKFIEARHEEIAAALAEWAQQDNKAVSACADAGRRGTTTSSK